MISTQTKYSFALLVLLAAEKVSSASNVYGKVATDGFGKKLRGSSSFPTTTGRYHRALPKGTPHPHHGGGGGGGGGHHSSYVGCLGYSTEELKESWSFYGAAPVCSYTHPDDGSGGGGGNDDGYDDYVTDDNGGDDGVNGDDGSEYGDDGSGGEGGNGGGNGSGNGNGNGGDDQGGNGGGDSSYDVVVTNEDVVNGTVDYDVYDDFNVTQCGTYGNLWTWDLSLSCTNKFSFEGCNCSFAEELVSAGLLDCDDGSQCPDDCPICGTCLSLIGCNVTNTPTFASPAVPLSTASILYIVAGVLLLLIIAAVVYRARRGQKDVSDMTKGLMAGENAIAGAVASGAATMNSTSPTWEPPSLSSPTTTSESIESPTAGAGAAGATAGAAAAAGAMGLYAVTKAGGGKPKDDDESSDGSYSGTATTRDESTIPEGTSQYDGSAHVVYAHTPTAEAAIEEETNDDDDGTYIEDEETDDAANTEDGDDVGDQVEEQSVTPFEEDLRPETPTPSSEKVSAAAGLLSSETDVPVLVPETTAAIVPSDDDTIEKDTDKLTPLSENDETPAVAAAAGSTEDEDNGELTSFEEDQLSSDDNKLGAAVDILSDTGADAPPSP